ncbi:hypothetical protein AB0A95_18225 [Micromonospora sp. NPDC049230]|uniref:hypothetical protein n=1 Tax=Micromonospora sp. NPDC049230 TaxID=3155502 RepID=UPI0033EFB1DC
MALAVISRAAGTDVPDPAPAHGVDALARLAPEPGREFSVADREGQAAMLRHRVSVPSTDADNAKFGAIGASGAIRNSYQNGDGRSRLTQRRSESPPQQSMSAP